VEAKEEFIEKLKRDENGFFYTSFKTDPDKVISLFNTLDNFIELVETKPFCAYLLVDYKNGTEIAKLIKTHSDFLRMFSVHSDFAELLFINSKQIQNLFNTPDLIIQLAMKSSSCALHVLAVEKYEEVQAIFSNYQINEHLLALAGMEHPHNPIIVISSYLPYKNIKEEEFNKLLQIIRANKTLNQQRVSNIEQYFIRAKDIHSGNSFFSHYGQSVFSLVENAFAGINVIFNKTFYPNNV
jgi:hypothetical protein